MSVAPRARAALVALAVLLVAANSRFVVRPLPRPLVNPGWNLLWVALVLGGLALAHRLRPRDAPAELGLSRTPWRGLAIAFVACLPMALVLALAAGGPPRGGDAGNLLRGSAIAPFAEELLFRGYAFRQLARRAGWRFWPAVVVTAAVFGLGHLGNVAEADLGTKLLEVGITALGGAFFAWLLERWDDLWVPIGVHAFMNLWWDLYEVDATAIGDGPANVARALAVATAIGITLRSTRRGAGRSAT